ncbi:MAG: MBL fold metallo-hydrolase [Halanaerobiales bacterium]
MHQSNCYIIGEKKKELTVIDPGAEGKRVLSELVKLKGELTQIINTHGHFDHLGGNRYLYENSDRAKVMIHQKEEDYLTDPEKNFSSLLGTGDIISPAADRLLEDRDKIKVNQDIFEVILTPGHSPGGICLLCREEKIMFCGDLIFKTGIGRTDLPGGNTEVIKNSIENKILSLEEDIVVYPGHGTETTIGDFKENVWPHINF